MEPVIFMATIFGIRGTAYCRTGGPEARATIEVASTMGGIGTAYKNQALPCHRLCGDAATGTEWALVGHSAGTSFIDLTDPENPVYARVLPMTDGEREIRWRDIKVYTHDAQCVVYRGPDADYRGSEICVGADETAAAIVDATDGVGRSPLPSRPIPASRGRGRRPVADRSLRPDPVGWRAWFDYCAGWVGLARSESLPNLETRTPCTPASRDFTSALPWDSLSARLRRSPDRQSPDQSPPQPSRPRFQPASWCRAARSSWEGPAGLRSPHAGRHRSRIDGVTGMH